MLRDTSVTRTSRLDSTLDQRLVDMAEKQNTSVNLIVQTALRRYVNWEELSNKFGFMAITASSLDKMMEYVPEEELVKMGRWSSQNVMKPLTSFFFMKENLESALAAIEILGTYGRRYRFDLASKDSKSHVMILTHGMGKKWSVLYEEMVRTRLSDFLGGEVKSFEMSSTENQVVADFVSEPYALANVTGARKYSDEPLIG